MAHEFKEGDRIRFEWHLRDVYGEKGTVVDPGPGVQQTNTTVTVVPDAWDVTAHVHETDIKRLDVVTELGEVADG